jgi:DNA sulfur modification protein DndD
MLFTELVLHNVGPYRGRQSISLATQPGKPIILIGGMNGCGKTTLLDAIQLGLYGNRANTSNRGSQAYEDYLTSLVSRGVDSKEGASVSISFNVTRDGESVSYQVSRSWSQSGKRMKESLDVFVDGNWDRTLSGTWADYVEDLLPLDIAGLFFFDGEKIEALADPERAAAVIQSAIDSLLGASTIEQLRADLTALKRRQIPDSGDAALEQELKDLVLLHERQADAVASLRLRLASVRMDVASAQERLEQAERNFAAEGGALFEERVAIESQRASQAAELEVARSQLRALAEGELPLAMLASKLDQLVILAHATRESERSREILDILANRDSWLLSRLPTDWQETVSILLEEDRDTRHLGSSTAGPLHGMASERLQRLSLVVERVESLVPTARDLFDRIKILEEEIAQTDKLLGQVPDEGQLATKVADRESARESLARLSGQLQVLEEDERALQSEIEALELRIARVEAKRIEQGVANDDKRRVLEHSERVRSTLAELRNQLIRRNLGRIEVATLESFRRLMAKADLVADLRIDPETYAVSLSTATGDPLPPSRLSAGERQLLAVALLWGLAKVAGNALPTVIDTPLGRLDSAHRAHLVERYFPHAGGQVLLLSTDEEIDAELFASLSSSIQASYLLKHDAQADSTHVEPGYWWEMSSHVA